MDSAKGDSPQFHISNQQKRRFQLLADNWNRLS